MALSKNIGLSSDLVKAEMTRYFPDALGPHYKIDTHNEDFKDWVVARYQYLKDGGDPDAGPLPTHAPPPPKKFRKTAEPKPPPVPRPAEPAPTHKFRSTVVESTTVDPLEQQRADNMVRYEARIGKYLDWTLRDIVTHFGTDSTFKEFLTSTRVIEDIEAKRIKNAASRGDLISRDFVTSHVLTLVEQMTVRLLSDVPRRLTTQLYAQSKAGIECGEAERDAREVISQIIKNVKNEAERNLAHA